MFEIDTTLVLGAGASVSYDYPTGEELTGRLIELCERNDGKRRYGHIADLLRSDAPVSIDTMLWHYRDQPEITEEIKRLVMKVIGESGKREYFRHETENRNWYRFLWRAIVDQITPADLAEGDDQKLLPFNIVTFNYDPSLEYFFLSRIYQIRSMFLSHDHKMKFAERIRDRIHHVYGCIQESPLGNFFTGSFENCVYIGVDDLDLLESLADHYKRIRMIDGREDPEQYAHLRSIVSNSQQVIFLGFGFDDINIGSRVLNLSQTLAPEGSEELYPVVKYTNFGNLPIIDSKVERVVGASRVIKSELSVYEALQKGFSLNTI